MSVQLDITVKDNFFIGSDKEFRVTIIDDNGQIVDLTGMDIEFKLSNAYSGPASFTIDADLVDPTEGVLSVMIPSANTINLVGDRDYWYTLRDVGIGEFDELMFGKIWLRDVFVDYSP